MVFKLKNKAQNEIVGFIVIVVIVVIIGLFLLVFYLRQEPIRTESKNVQNFLKSSLLYTTSCNISTEYLDISDVMKRCYEGTTCSDGRDSCEVLNETYIELLEETWKINSNRPVNYYLLDVYYREEDENDKENTINEPILSLESGNCSGSITGGENFIYYKSGNIFADLKICYN